MAEDKAARGTGRKTKAQSGQGTTAKSGADKAATGKSGTTRPGSRPKAVKPPTINLKAEEIGSETAADTSARSQSSAGENAKPEAAGASISAKKQEPKTDAKPQAARDSVGQPEPDQPRKGGLGLMGYAGAGAVGAVAAAAVSLGMNTVGVRTPDTSALETRIEQLAAQNADAVALQQQIDVLQARQAQLTEQVGSGSTGEDSAALTDLRTSLEASISETRNQLDQLAQTIESLPTQAKSETGQVLQSEIAVLTDRLADAEERLGQVATSEELTRLQAVIAQATSGGDEPGTQLSGLAELGRAVSDRNDALSARINALEPAMQSLSETVAALESRIAESLGIGASMSDIEGLGDRIASIDGQFGDLRNAVAGAQAKVDATEQLLAEYDSRLAAAESGIAAVRSSLGAVQNRASSGAADEAATALAVAQLQDAAQRGGSFAASLETLAALLDGERPELSILTTHAETGVPTVTDLAARFEGVAGDIVAAGGVREDAGILGRLVDNARGIVSVRPVSPVSGETPAAIVSRISGHLADGNLDAARSEWATLPDPARGAAADWGDQLAARAEVDQAMTQLTTSLLADLSNAAGRAPATQ
jgi:hypothetical protein